MTGRERIKALCGLVLVGSFFLPWTDFFGIRVSGFDLTELGSYLRFTWVVPALGGLVVAVSVLQAGGSQRVMAVAAGLAPWALLVVVVADMGVEVIQLLSVGAYLALLAGLTLLFTASRPSPTREEEEAQRTLTES